MIRSHREGENLARFSDFIAELKRRRVIRALLGWGILAFAVLQVYEPIMHGLHLPEWSLTLVVVALAAGFPVTVVLAWIFDMGPGGIERTAPAPEGMVTPARRVRVGMLLVALGLLVSAPGLAWYLARRPGPPPASSPGATPTPSVAVLPFANLSSDKEQEFFSDGISEEILNALAQVDGLHVAGRTSSFAFKGKNEDLAGIAQKLRVGSVLEGSVRKDGSRVRITAQLVDATNGFHVWSQTFDRELTGVFAIQDEIARAVVDALKVKLLPGRAPAVVDHRPRSTEAYEQYLLGRDYQRRAQTPRNGHLAAEAFRKALALDAGYAPAWVGLSWALSVLADDATTPEGVIEALRQSLAAAEKAIALDPGLADGYAQRAGLRQTLDWDFAGAEADIERALALGPSSARPNRGRGVILMSLGRAKEGIASLRKAADLDPLAGVSWVTLAQAHLVLGDIASARAALERGRELVPDGVFVWYFLGLTSLLEGQPAAALAAFERSPEESWRTTGVALAQHSLGNTTAAAEALDALTSRHANAFAYQIATVHAWRGERDLAFEWLERAYRQHDGGLVDLKFDPLLRSVRDDPRYAALLRKMNLPVD